MSVDLNEYGVRNNSSIPNGSWRNSLSYKLLEYDSEKSREERCETRLTHSGDNVFFF